MAALSRSISTFTCGFLSCRSLSTSTKPGQGLIFSIRRPPGLYSSSVSEPFGG